MVDAMQTFSSGVRVVLGEKVECPRAPGDADQYQDEGIPERTGPRATNLAG